MAHIRTDMDRGEIANEFMNHLLLTAFGLDNTLLESRCEATRTLAISSAEERLRRNEWRNRYCVAPD